MRFADPYTDDSQAAELAAGLQAASPRAASRPSTGSARRRGSTWSRRSLGPHLEALGRGRELFALRPGVGGPGRARRAGADAGKLDDDQAEPARSRRWATRSRGVLAAHRGQPVAGVVLATDGRSNAGEDPLRAAEAAVRQDIPIFADRRRGRRGAAERPARRDRGQPGRLRPRPDDPGRRRRGPRPARTPRRRSSSSSGSTTATGSRSATSGSSLGEDGILKRTTFRITPKVVGQYEFRARVEDAGPELTLDDNVATAAVRVVRQQIRVLLIAGGPSPEVQFLRNALHARPARRVRRLAPARRPRLPPGRATGRSRGCPTTPTSSAGTTPSSWSTPTCGPSARSGPR